MGWELRVIRWRAIREAFGFIRGNVLVLTITGALGMFCRSLVFPYVSLYILALGGEPSQIGLITSLAPLAGLIMFPIAGYLTDRAGRVRLIVLAGYLSGAILLLNVFAPDWRFVALASLLMGFLVFQFPPSSAIIADSLAPDRRALGIATMRTIAGLVALASPTIAGALIDAVGVDPGMRYLYAALAASSFASATIHARFLRETARSELRVSLTSLPAVFWDACCGLPGLLRGLGRPLRALAAVITLGFVANAIASPYWVVYAVERIGLSSVEWGLILLLENLVRNVAFIPAGMLVDRWGRSRLMLAALAIVLVSVPPFILATNFTHVLLIRLAVALANAIFTPASSALMADLAPRENRGRIMAALGRGAVMLAPAMGGTGGPGVGLIITVPLMLSALLGGVLYEFNPILPWLAIAAVAVVSLALVAAFVRDPDRAHV